LNAANRLSAELWRKHRAYCRLRRFHEGEDDRIGRLARHPGGSWYVDYDSARQSDDEAGYRLGDERFALDEYVSIADAHARMHTFQVVSVQPV
jgi:hypothetical protein